MLLGMSEDKKIASTKLVLQISDDLKNFQLNFISEDPMTFEVLYKCLEQVVQEAHVLFEKHLVKSNDHLN